MATIERQVDVACSPELAWAQLRDFGSAARLFAGVLTDCRLAGDVRTVVFQNGLVARERLVRADDARRRLAYTVLDGPFTHHNASMQLVPAPDGLRFQWISDFLPDEAAAKVEPLVDAGCAAIKRSLEALLG